MAEEKRSDAKNSKVNNSSNNSQSSTNQSKTKILRGNNMESQSINPTVDDNPDFQNGISEEELKNNLINNFSSNEKKIELEKQRESILNQIGLLEDSIKELSTELGSLNKTNKEGKIEKLSIAEKTLKTAELAVLKDRRDKLQNELSEVEEKLINLMKYYKKIIDRSKVRARAMMESYHNRYNEDIKKAISKFIASVDSEVLQLFVDKLSKAPRIEKERIALTFCGKAPKFLDTRISANQEWKKKYMKYFFEELNKIK